MVRLLLLTPHRRASTMSKGKVAIIGSGMIGSNWATLFCSAGYSVAFYDVSQAQVDAARERVRESLDYMQREGLSRPGALAPSAALALVTSSTILEEALRDAIYAQESTLECVNFRLKLYAELDVVAAPSCILASSTSTIPSSSFTGNLKNRSRCLVVHPVNPPLLVPLVEIVPAPWTAAEVVDRAVAIISDIGQEPIRLAREVAGFAVNRIQYAVMAESWRLVADGILSPEDVDKVMSSGLALRYAFYGPFEVMQLNANGGVEDYCKRYAAGIRGVLADFGPNPSFEDEAVIEKLKSYLNARMPVAELAKSHEERNERLAAIAKLKLKLKKE